MALVGTTMNEESVGIDNYGPMDLRWGPGIVQLRTLLSGWGLHGND